CRIHDSVNFPTDSNSEISTLSLHDALPIYAGHLPRSHDTYQFLDPLALNQHQHHQKFPESHHKKQMTYDVYQMNQMGKCGLNDRSEEHTSELQSRFDIVCRLLLEKKYNTKK